MQDITKFYKLVLVILALCLSVWIGGTLLRITIAYDIFVPGTELVLKPELSDDIRMHTVRLFSLASVYTEICYCLAFLSVLLLSIKYRKLFKQKSWFFMSAFLFFITVPVESYMIYLDINLGWVIFWQNINDYYNSVVQNAFVFRITKLNILTSLEFLAIITSVIFSIWKPLNIKD